MNRLGKENCSLFDTETLINLLAIKAGNEADGHFTIFRFTTEWKVMVETPDLRCGQDYEFVSKSPGFKSLNEALINALVGYDTEGLKNP